MTTSVRPIGADTQVCISVSSRPTSIGTRFHNHLYAQLGLDFVYKAFRTTDIVGTIAGVRALNIRGCSVSMPHKEAVLPLVDAIAPSAAAIGSVNTIVNDDGVLTASNTDYLAVDELLDESGVDPTLPVLLHGSGGMAKAIAAVLHARGASEVTVLSRNGEAGAALAGTYGFASTTVLPEPGSQTLINATPIGMHGPDADRPAFPPDHIQQASTVMDVVASPWRTPLIEAAMRAGLTSISGDAVIARQAAKQFVLYTGVTPTLEQVALASRYSRPASD